MAVTNEAVNYREAQSFELRRLRLLTGAAAREKANALRGDVLKVALAVTAVFVYLLAITLIEGQISAVGAEINGVKAEIAAVENDSLRMDLMIGELESLERIETYAVENLGMVCPTAADIYYLNAETSAWLAQGDAAPTELAAVTATGAATVAPEQGNDLWQKLSAFWQKYWNGEATAAALTASID